MGIGISVMLIVVNIWLMISVSLEFVISVVVWGVGFLSGIIWGMVCFLVLICVFVLLVVLVLSCRM